MSRAEIGSYPGNPEKNISEKVYLESADILKENGKLTSVASLEFMTGKVGLSFGLIIDVKRRESGGQYKISLVTEPPDNPLDDPQELLKERKSNIFMFIDRKGKIDSFPDRILKMESNGDISICKGRGTGFREIQDMELQEYLNLLRELGNLHSYRKFEYKISHLPFIQSTRKHSPALKEKE